MRRRPWAGCRQRARRRWRNLVGASLILLSLMRNFNLSAAIVEGAWAVIALIGLIRLAFGRLRAGPRG